MQSYKSGSHTRYDVKYHIVWITKYRKPIMVGPVAEHLCELIRQICQQKRSHYHKGSYFQRPSSPFGIQFTKFSRQPFSSET